MSNDFFSFEVRFIAFSVQRPVGEPATADQARAPKSALRNGVRGLAQNRRFNPLAVVALILMAGTLGGCGSLSFGSGRMLTDRECLARVMYFESNRSSEDGMLAVGTVVMNRLDSHRYPSSICGVVGQRNQFAEGALSKPVGRRSFEKALRVADAVMAGERHPGVGKAMFFHTAGYHYPYKNMHYVVLAGGNAFYEKRRPGSLPWAPPESLSPTVMVAAATPRREPEQRIMVAAVVPPSEPRFTPRPIVVAAAAPRFEPRHALPPRPIVLAMVEPTRRQASKSPTIEDLIEMDLAQR